MSPWRRLVFDVPDDVHDDLIALLHDAGSLGIESRDGLLHAFFETPEVSAVSAASALEPQVLAQLEAGLGRRGEKIVLRASEEVADGQWHERWMAGLRPFEVAGRFLIVPGREPESPAEGREILRLTPGRAFGTGEHITTRMCLEGIASLLGPEDSLLDVGTGSGILAIAARRLTRGAVAGLDTDAGSLEVAARNAALNGATDIWWLAGPLDALAPRPFDLVVANIAGATLQRLLPDLSRRARRTLLLAGILEEEEDDMRRACARLGLPAPRVEREAGWLGMTVGAAGR